MSFKYIKVKTKGQNEGENLLVPKLRFKEFNNQWNTYKLEELVIFLDSQRKPIKDSDRNKFRGVYPYYGASGIIDYVKDYIFDKDTILLSEDGANILTRSTRLAFIASGKYWVNNHAHVLEPKNTNIYFLCELLESLNYEQYNTGTAQPKLNQEICKNIGLTVPDIMEQSKIGNFLSLLDKKIELQNQKIEALKIYKRGLIQKIYQTNYNNKIKMKKILIQKSIRNTNDKKYNVYSVNNKDGFILQTEQFKERMVASEDTRNYKVVEKDDFAYNPARINVGSIARMKQDIKGIISPMYICFKCNEKIIPEYLEYFFESSKFTYEMNKRLEGSVRMCLSYESMLNIPIELPNKNEQEKTSEILKSLSQKIKKEEKKYMELNMLKKGLLQKMFI